MDHRTGTQSLGKGLRAKASGKIEVYFRHRGEFYCETLELSAGNRSHVKAARKYLEDWKAAVKTGVHVENTEPENPLCRTVARSYLQHQLTRLKRSTVASYEDALNIYWLPFIERTPVRAIKYAHLREIDAKIDWPSEKTRKNARVPLAGMFRYALHGDLIDHNPVDKFEPIKLDRKLAGAYTAEQRTRLIDWLRQNAPPVPAMYFRTAFGTGMRTAELIGLKGSAYDEAGFLVSETIVRGERTDTKTHRERYVPLSPSLRKEFEEFRTEQASKQGLTYYRGPIFLNQYGRAFTRSDHINRWFHRACEDTGIPDLLGKHSPYPWRHTFITLAIENSLELGRPVDLITLSDSTGHSMEVMLKVYRSVKRRKSYDDHFEKIGDM